jgi:hypothetical protein
MKTAQEITDRLPYFTGTQVWHRYIGGLLLTEGVVYLCESAECFWLVDVIWSYQPLCKKDDMLRVQQF